MAFRRAFTFPSPYTVLLLVIVLAALATWLLPSGQYDMLRYDEAQAAFVVQRADSVQTLPATRQTLDNLGITIALEKFVDQSIRRPIAVPGTYHTAEAQPQGFIAILQAPILGIYEAVDVILFVLIIGGCIGVFNRSGAFEAGIAVLAQRLKGREGLLIVIVTALMALGGSTYGLAEETLAFYPVLVPIFLAAGYDVLVPLAVIFVGAQIGYTASTTNPFATIIASDAAGISWAAGLYGRLLMLVVGTGVCIVYIIRYARRVQADPTRSLVYKAGDGVEAPAVAAAPTKPAKMTGKIRLLLVLFALTFVVMIFGVSRLGWWFVEMSALFLGASVVFGIIQGGGEKAILHAFIAGARDLLGVAFIIGIARGVTVVLNEGLISDTILHQAAGAVQEMSGAVFIVALMFVYFGLTLFIASSSGMAVLTMPILAGLAEVVGVPRVEIVNAYLYGMGIMGFVTPAGLILPSLEMVKVDYSTWLKFIGPLLGLLTLLSAVWLAVGVLTA